MFNFGLTAATAQVGEILCQDLAERNTWKLRMIKAGLGEGFIIPDDWDELSEDEKAGRLDKVIEMLKEEA
jgi:hypothetical protein